MAKTIDFRIERQWLTLFLLCGADFCSGLCVSLPTPLYPPEAEKKGATVTEYGFVFGAYELTIFLVSPYYGQRMNEIGPKELLKKGIFMASICCILFGFLDEVQNHYLFIILSLVIRILAAMGSAAYSTTSFAIAAKEFPNNVSTIFALKETMSALGLIFGPVIGALLNEVGGYTTPFATLGSIFFLFGVIICLLLPDQTEVSTSEKVSFLQFLRIPGVSIAACNIALAAFNFGFLMATLEPHLRQFDLSAMALGSMFAIDGIMYGISSPCFGWLCDRKIISPAVVVLLGSCFFTICFSLLGPAPFIQAPPMLSWTIVGLGFLGLGSGACMNGGFNLALRTVIARGYPNDIQTNGLVSSLWSSSMACGLFIGPPVAGVLKDILGFRNATMVVIVICCIVGAITATFICQSSPRYTYERLPSLNELCANTSNGFNLSSNTFNLETRDAHPKSNGNLYH